MTPRTFEDHLKELLKRGGVIGSEMGESGRPVVVVRVGGEEPVVYQVQESRVEPATFGSPSQGDIS